jgi:folate-dependent phosphoribosylglycinamide formyltransferase PurN
MTRILLVLRNGEDARFLLNELSISEDVTIHVVLESGKIARKKKLKRMLKGSMLHKLYVGILQVPLLVIYDQSQRFLMFRDYVPSNAKREFETYRVDDINAKEFIAYVNDIDPALMLSYGTALYNSETLKQLPLPVLNIHSGILPKYRNVHTDFWAYVSNDYDGIGVTLFKLTEKIDLGPFVTEVRSVVGDRDYLWNVKMQNLSNILHLIEDTVHRCEALELHEEKSKGSEDTQNQISLLWPTPSASALIKYLKMEFTKIIKNLIQIR